MLTNNRWVQRHQIGGGSMALEGLKAGIFNAFGLLKGKKKIDEEQLSELVKNLRRALQEADFNVRQNKEITERLARRMREEEARPGVNLQTHAMNILYTELVRILGPAKEINPRQQTILMVGLYGKVKLQQPQNLPIGGVENMGQK